MPHLLEGYYLARRERLISRFVLVVPVEGQKMYFAGLGTFSPDRDMAIRFENRPDELLCRFHNASLEPA